MSSGAADLHKTINAVWDASGLDALFQALHNSDVTASEWEILNDTEAAAGQPFPYCIYQLFTGALVTQMSSMNPGFVRQIHDVTGEFRIHAKRTSGDSRSAKQLAAYLMDEVKKVFGGHPDTTPSTPVLDNGNFLTTQYQNDLGIRTGDSEYQWNITYRFRLDVPIAV